ncbi:DUF6392 family protein [Pseudomonas sp. BBP2017]|uniref:DUF6392 family protein n=1 Tax=Pseudomonas sp. BBP2017 TaxID=2109731 RepID=UPI0011B1FA5B|nr:DUF6392 family protein [Pseudomonas sp. BBP2017]
MKKLTLCAWIERLGSSHDALINQGILPNLPLKSLFYGHDVETFPAAPGLELEFSTGSAKLKCVHVTLISTLPDELTYRGELPERLRGVTTGKTAREILGAPYRSHPPVQMPLPMGQTGGWEAFTYDCTCNPPVSVMLQYTSSQQVCDVAFFQEPIMAQEV